MNGCHKCKVEPWCDKHGDGGTIYCCHPCPEHDVTKRAVIYVDDSEKRKRQEAALAWIAKGWVVGEMECKTVGYLPPRVGPHHCPACWMYEAKRLAGEAVK